MRAPARFGAVVALALAALVGLGLARARPGWRRGTPVGAVLLGLTLEAAPPRFTLAAADLPNPAAFAALRGRGVTTLVVQTALTPGTRWDGVERRLLSWPGVRRVARAPGVEVFDVDRAGSSP